MFEILKTLTLVFSFFNSAYALNQYASITCTSSFCKTALDPCLKCYGVTQCKKCISTIEQDCFPCADEIYTSKNITIGKNQYQMCSGINDLSSKICHLYCRGYFHYTGMCNILNDIPVCHCSDITNPYPLTTMSSSLNVNIKIHNNYTISPKEEPVKIKGLPNGNLAFGNSEIFILNVLKDQIELNLSSNLYSIQAMDIEMNGNLVILSKFESLVNILNIQETNETVENFNLTGFCLKVLENNNLAICQDSEVKIIDILDGTQKFSLIGHENSVTCVEVLEYNLIASGSRDGSIKIWNYENGNLIQDYTLSNSSVTSLRYLKNGNLVSGHSEGTIRVWTKSGDLAFVINGHSNAVSSLASLNSRYLVSGSVDRYFKIWDLDRQSEIFNHRTRPIFGVEYFGNGFLAVSSHNQIDIWEIHF